MRIQSIIRPFVAASTIALASAGLTSCESKEEANRYAENWDTELKESIDSVKNLNKSGQIPFAEYYISSKQLIDSKPITKPSVEEDLNNQKDFYRDILESEKQCDKFKSQLQEGGYDWKRPDECGVYAKALQDFGVEKIHFLLRPLEDTDDRGMLAFEKDDKTHIVYFKELEDDTVVGDIGALSSRDGVRHDAVDFKCKTTFDGEVYQTDIELADGTKKYYEYSKDEIL